MTPSELLSLFRSEVSDVAEPQLWSDEEFYAYLNEAQDLFVRLIGGIADRRSPMTKLTYKTGDQFKKYDDRILRIKGAFDEQNRILGIRNLDNFESRYLEDDYGVNFTNAALDDGSTGSIRFLITDVEANEIQFYPLPDHDGFVRLYVYRRPLEEITGGSSVLEISAHHHLNLLNWVKYKAYMKQDVESFEGTRATEFRQAFVDWVVEAKKEKSSREDRKRTVVYGGIPMS
jgi:hypothetical protein